MPFRFSSPVLTALILASTTSGAVFADSFDDAVNHYLKGFDYCTSAKNALDSGNTNKARSDFSRYQTYQEQASKMDGSILTSSQRGMSSNLKYCKRVGTDIEQAQGRPILEQAFKACDQANTQLKQGEVESANQYFAEFKELRDQALLAAPSINGVFSLRSKIRRCERIEKKIASAGKQQAAVTLALESAQDSSASYVKVCQAAQKDINNTAVTTPAIKKARGILASVESSRADALEDYSTLKEAAKDQASPEQKEIEKQLNQGNSCLASLEKGLAQKESQLNKVNQQAKGHIAKLDSANRTCSSIKKLQSVDKPQYDKARGQFEQARRTRNSVKSALAKSPYSGDSGDKLNKKMAALNTCLDQSRAHLSKLLTSISAPAAQAAPAASGLVLELSANKNVKPSAKKTNITPPSAINGVIQINDISPDFAIVYWLDGKAQTEEVKVVLNPTRFNENVFILQQGGTLRLVNDDFKTHSVNASLNGENLFHAKVRSRQRRTVKADWPENNIAVLRSDQARVAESYIVTLKSDNYKLLSFNDDNNTVEFDLSNTNKAQKGYLLMPDYDPIPFQVGQGEVVTLPITRGSTALGTLSLKGR